MDADADADGVLSMLIIHGDHDEDDEKEKETKTNVVSTGCLARLQATPGLVSSQATLVVPALAALAIRIPGARPLSHSFLRCWRGG